MSRISPLHHIHQAAAAQFVERGGWQIPQYASLSPTAAVSVVDRSWDYKLQVEGADTAVVLKRAFEDVPQKNGAVKVFADGVVFGRITPSRYLLISAPDSQTSIMARLTDATGDEFVTLTDQSDGQGGLRIAGDGAVSLMRTLCALDFDATNFPVKTVKISSFAKVRATIWHLSDGFHIYVGRSYAEYLWEVIEQAKLFLGR